MATANDSPTNLATVSLTSAMQRLKLDPDLADLTVTCGDRKWKVHSNILAVRSPFFKAAVTTNMVEKLEMNIDIKEFDPSAMEEVLNFMYGIHKENASVQFLLEAAERFQMKDLKEYAVKIAMKEMSVENVVELGHIAELYRTEDLLADCAAFIVKNDVPLSGQNTSPKLAVMVVGILRGDIQKLNDDNHMVVNILKDDNQKLKFDNLKLKGTLLDCENKLKAEVDWIWLNKVHLNGQRLDHVGNNYDVGSALAKMPLSKSNHSFEIEIIDCGSTCDIAIGLARKDYPKDDYPGHAEGCIAYHADDGNVYMGNDGGVPFGSRCNKGDIMCCGIVFPSAAEDDRTVQVYFTKNGKFIGIKKMGSSQLSGRGAVRRKSGWTSNQIVTNF